MITEHWAYKELTLFLAAIFILIQQIAVKYNIEDRLHHSL